jgi:hypothetical protein
LPVSRGRHDEYERDRRTSCVNCRRDGDLVIPLKVSHLMTGLIPNAQIRVYPDAAHAFLFQYPAEVAADINTFLNNDHIKGSR